MLEGGSVILIAGSVIFLCDTVVIAVCNHHYYFCRSFFFPFSDPEHQRAKGNLKYFEFQLEKQKKTAEDRTQKQKERGKRETTEKTKKPKKKDSNQLVPERKKYEMLCRGEGNKMVRTTKRRTKTQFHKIHLSFIAFVPCFPFLSIRPPAGRAGCSVVTMTTITTPCTYWRLSNSKMSGTAPTSSATLTSSPTKKSSGSSNWQSHEWVILSSFSAPMMHDKAISSFYSLLWYSRNIRWAFSVSLMWFSVLRGGRSELWGWLMWCC